MFRHVTHTGRRVYSTIGSFASVPVLQDATLPTFRSAAFTPAQPQLLPRGHFASLPAVNKWFHPDSTLNQAYLVQYSDAYVPLEITTSDGEFVRVTQPLSFFLGASSGNIQGASVYLAQASLTDLPQALSNDVPIPDIVLRAGKGDVYDSSLWIGQAPTYTPLHRDPNPNLFVQLAGSKRVRLFGPEVGGEIFARVQRIVGGGGSATMRGEEMMMGDERKVLEEAVWEGQHGVVPQGQGWECEVHAGDGLFVPKGWWHSIKGIGEQMTGSVSGRAFYVHSLDLICTGQLVVQVRNRPSHKAPSTCSPRPSPRSPRSWSYGSMA